MTITYNNSIEKLLQAIPEFKKSYDFKVLKSSQDLPDIVYGSLSVFFERLYKEKPESLLIFKVAIFLEEMASSPDREAVNLLAVSFLENFSPFKPYFSEIKKAFGEKTQKLLDEVILRG